MEHPESSGGVAYGDTDCFLNYVLLRLYSTCGLYYPAIFGGLVNSTAVIAQLSGPLAAAGPNARPMAIVVILLTIVSMFLRNLAMLLIFSPSAGLIASTDGQQGTDCRRIRVVAAPFPG
jgi:hypothetical protein